MLALSDRLDVVYYLIRESVLNELGRRPTTPLSELCVPIRTKTPAREAYVPEGVPCIKLRNVTGEMLNLSNCAYIPERLKDKFVAAKSKDIIVTATGEGTAGRADIFLESSTYIVTGENILLRPKLDRTNPFYLLAMLRTDHIAKQLTHYVRGATGQTHLYWHDIGNIEVPDADKKVQQECERLFKEAAELRKKSNDVLMRFKATGAAVMT